jgi:TetR/AcrR family fatty acid metabolism transcriptional regulator
MRVNPEGGRTFTSQARRAQIVAASIETIAEAGFARTSFALIAQRAGLSSTRMISYHFRGKDDLMEAVVTEVFSTAAEFIEPFVLAQSTPAGQLRGLIEGHARFYAEHRTQVLAVRDIWFCFRKPDGTRRYTVDAFELEFAVVSEIFRAGQACGEFRDFDRRFMASTLRHALDGLAELIAADPALDVDASTRELVAIFEGATRSTR